MVFSSDAAMVLYCDFAGDYADHDTWHTYEHIHERLSIPGFLRATRWTAIRGAPNYLIVYEVTGTEVATSAAYLARLNDPTPWTASIMPHIHGMIRGFCTTVAGEGFGLGNAAVAVRFSPQPGREAELVDRLTRDVVPAMSAWRGMASVRLLRPMPPPPMTKEQSIRGPDMPLGWLLMATAYDADALERAAAEHCGREAFERSGALPDIAVGAYNLHYTATAEEAARAAPGWTPPHAGGSVG